ncbi:siderophore ABC transporter substrate-binding protein [Arthrobacter sp. CAU 1506]|uniref:siderophore ABC transporter substrate-binding protein n=1 Tax=Arthrobacter sp. CAU 1506 TaxID=2560052 RepID=UPI001F0E9CEB|nr:siderophore ABC transporter substrate-binding protein [Arthrobacter sp. CAU 1506]
MKNPLKSGLLVMTAAVSMLAMSACGQQTDAAADAGAETISIEHASGTTEVPVNPETVYTFDLGALDSLTALGVEVDGVPEAVYPKSLAQYGEDSYTKIGSMKEPDFEAISEGAPDLIIISGRTAEAYGELSKIAPTIDLSVDAAAPVDSFKEVSTTLGQIFGKEAEVEDKLSALDTKIEDTKAAAADAGTGLVLMTSGGEMTAYGAGSRFGIVHDVLGVQPAAEVKSEGPHGEAISHEFVAKTNPDHLFVIDRDSAVGESGGEAASAVLDNDLVNGTKAAKNDSITYLDSASWYLVGYGLNNTDAMISAVQAAITK